MSSNIEGKIVVITERLRQEVKPYNLRTTVISPGGRLCHQPAGGSRRERDPVPAHTPGVLASSWRKTQPGALCPSPTRDNATRFALKSSYVE
jgi:hypothetical protein